MRLLAVISFLLFLWRGIEADQNDSTPFWDYSEQAGPDKWKELYPSCNGSKQSPIDLFRAEILRAPRYERINFFGYRTLVKDAYLENNGRTVQLVIEDPIQRFTGGGLNGTYKFSKIVFHWGHVSELGSEHSFAGGHAPLEMQLIHYNTRYEPQEAANKPDGLAVLSVIFEVFRDDNRKLKPILDVFKEIIEENSLAKIEDPFYLGDLLPSTSNKNYFRYWGSLTTPPCHESVSWTIFQRKVAISEHQLRKFRRLKKSSGYNLGNNFRSEEPVNERVVVLYTENPTYDNINGPIIVRDDDDDRDIDIDIDIKFKNKHKNKYKDKHKDKDIYVIKDKSKDKDKYKVKGKKKGAGSNSVPTVLLVLAVAMININNYL